MVDENLLPRAINLIRCALADLEGIMPEIDSTGDREHPGWRTMKEMIDFLKDAGQDIAEYQGRYPYDNAPFEDESANRLAARRQ
jgi:2-iminoacetate synthase ThiH